MRNVKSGSHLKGDCHFSFWIDDAKLFLHRLCHFRFHRVIQILGFPLAQRIAWRFEMIRELLRESLIEGCVYFLFVRRSFLFPLAYENQRL